MLAPCSRDRPRLGERIGLAEHCVEQPQQLRRGSFNCSGASPHHDWRENRKGEHMFAFLTEDLFYKSRLKVELIDIILRKDGRRAKQDLAAVDDFEFT